MPGGQPRNLLCEAFDFLGCIEGGDAGADCPSLQRPGRLMGQRRAVQAGTDGNPSGAQGLAYRFTVHSVYLEGEHAGLDGSPIPVDSHAGNAGQSGSRLADQAALMGQNTLRPLCLNITKSLQQAGNAGHVVGACLQAVGQEIGHGLERRGASGAAHE